MGSSLIANLLQFGALVRSLSEPIVYCFCSWGCICGIAFPTNNHRASRYIQVWAHLRVLLPQSPKMNFGYSTDISILQPTILNTTSKFDEVTSQQAEMWFYLYRIWNGRLVCPDTEIQSSGNCSVTSHPSLPGTVVFAEPGSSRFKTGNIQANLDKLTSLAGKGWAQ